MAMRVLSLLLILLLGEASITPREWLGEDSVVLICGAASYLGSEVALALHRIYSPKRVILVDELTSASDVEGLSRLEFQRQRLFRVLQEIATSESGNVLFYRVDLRPEVPEFVDSSVVPVLEYIIKEHNDISHILYIPEEKTLEEKGEGNPKAFLMHALLDQLVHWQNSTGCTNLPQFTYLSSFKVYSGEGAASRGVYRGREDRPITEAPISLEGSAYVLDEILAQTYFENHHIETTGLRLFSVYGPFDTPLSLTSQIADHAVAAMTDSSGFLALPKEAFESQHDFVFVDDAVDAIMLAMQLRYRSGPLVINVGSGQSTRALDLVNIVQSFVPGAKFKSIKSTQKLAKQVDIVAQPDRAKELLGWQPNVSLEQGMLRTLGWHFDRLYPRGKSPPSGDENNEQSGHGASWGKIAAAGRLSCDSADVECLRGAPVYPCASECAHTGQCLASFWDVPASISRQLSSGCSEVWYTVALNSDLVALPSVKVRVSTQSRWNLTKCNFAFVSESSPLAQRIKSKAGGDSRLEYDFWTLIPVADDPAKDTYITSLVMLPKLSPSSFFGHSVEIALYTDPHIIIDDLQKLLTEARMQPYNPDVPGATGLLVGKGGTGSVKERVISFDKQGVHQTGAYRMMHMKLMGYLNASRDGFKYEMDTSFLVHRVRDQDVMSFRCDVFGEAWSWKVATDREAMSFVAGLHDMWSQIIVGQNDGKKGTGDVEPWWYGDSVETVSDASQHHRRRLEETKTGQKAPLQYHHFLQNRIDIDEDENFKQVHHFDENGFTIQKKQLEQTGQTQPGASTTGQKSELEDELEGENEYLESDENMTECKNQKWLGMLSSGRTRFFIRLVPADDVGVVDLNRVSDQGPSLIL
ncbi:hypothetical protein ACA910_010662 [Epithemia clementina (nom. ined.)]